MAGGTSGIYARKIRIVTVPITVSGGTGSGTFTLTGFIGKIAVQAPAGAAYGYMIIDADGYGVEGLGGLTNDYAGTVEEICDGLNTITITGTDGAYSVRLRVELGLFSV